MAYEQNKDLLAGDGEISRHALMVGELDFYPGTDSFKIVNYGAHVMFSLAITGLRTKDKILRGFFDRDSKKYKIFKHQTPEIYYRSKSYTLSAGGVHVNRLDGGTKLNDGWAMPTTLLTKYDANPKKENFFRFKGNRHRLRRKNTCVYNNFACGLNFSHPTNFNKNCGVNKANFIFYDLSSNECGNHANLYMALRLKNCKKYSCKRVAVNYGFFEIREKKDLYFSQFINSVVKNNENNEEIFFNKTAKYITSHGEQIHFNLDSSKKNLWEITKINEQAVEINFNNWPNGLLQINNLFLNP